MTTEPDYARALPIAAERLNAAYKAMHGQNGPWAAGDYHSAVITVAKLIAKYEPPPADPAEEAVVRFLNAWFAMDWPIERWKASRPTSFPFAVQALREILAEQGKS